MSNKGEVLYQKLKKYVEICDKYLDEGRLSSNDVLVREFNNGYDLAVGLISDDLRTMLDEYEEE